MYVIIRMKLTEQNHKALHTITVQMSQRVMLIGLMKLITKDWNSNKFFILILNKAKEVMLVTSRGRQFQSLVPLHYRSL